MVFGGTLTDDPETGGTIAGVAAPGPAVVEAVTPVIGVAVLLLLLPLLFGLVDADAEEDRIGFAAAAAWACCCC